MTTRTGWSVSDWIDSEEVILLKKPITITKFAEEVDKFLYCPENSNGNCDDSNRMDIHVSS